MQIKWWKPVEFALGLVATGLRALSELVCPHVNAKLVATRAAAHPGREIRCARCLKTLVPAGPPASVQPPPADGAPS